MGVFLLLLLNPTRCRTALTIGKPHRVVKTLSDHDQIKRLIPNSGVRGPRVAQVGQRPAWVAEPREVVLKP